jgi:Mrp family chromosome partitioning ATPase
LISRRNDPTTDATRTIDLRDVLTFLRRGALLALFVAAVAGATAYVTTSNADPTYRASIALVASQPGSGFGTLDVVAPPPVDPAVYRTALLEGNIVADALFRLNGERPSERELDLFLDTIRVSVENQQISSVIRIEVDHRDPVYAADAANAISDELIAWDRERARRTLTRGVEEIERAIRQIDAELTGDLAADRRAALNSLRQQRAQELSVAVSTASSAFVVGLLEPLRVASPPERAIGPRVLFSTVIAVLLGLVGGYGLLFVRGALDTRLGDRDAVADLTGLPVLAEFGPRRRGARRLSAETASFLRTNLLLATRNTKPRIVVITSPVTESEKDGVAVALADSFARGGNRTLLVDADLRHPATTAWLDVVPSHAAPFEVYLANPDRRYLPVSVAVAQKRTFDFVPSFTSARFPVELLNEGLPAQLEAWRNEYDVIILDATPVIAFADTLAIAPLATGVVVSASGRRTSREQLREAVRSLDRDGVQVLGVVITERHSRKRRMRDDQDVMLVEDEAIDPYKTAVPPTRRPVDERAR